MSRNGNCGLMFKPNGVTSREGRVSRNNNETDKSMVKGVTSREGRVSRNRDMRFT